MTRPDEPMRRGVRVSVPLVVAAACIVILIGVVACGNDDNGRAGAGTSTALQPDTPSSPAIITDKDVAGVPEGSPQRAVLRWFQSIQFKDVGGAAESVDPAILKRVGHAAFADAVKTVGPALGRPSFVGTRRRGDQAALRVLVVGYGADGMPAGSEAVTLYLRRSGATWRVANLDYLIRSSDAMARAERRRP